MSEYLIIQIMIRVSDRIVREIVDFYFYGYISKLPHAKKYLTKKLIKKVLSSSVRISFMKMDRKNKPKSIARQRLKMIAVI